MAKTNTAHYTSFLQKCTELDFVYLIGCISLLPIDEMQEKDKKQK